jgi:hypothetical protein
MASEWILGRLAGGVEWIHLAQNKDRWRLLWIRWWTFGFWRHGVSYMHFLDLSRAAFPTDLIIVHLNILITTYLVKSTHTNYEGPRCGVFSSFL